MKKVIIHAGPGKTGSSAIQHYLSENVSQLKSNGILYPSHKTDENSVSSGNFKEVLSITEDKKFIIDDKKLDDLLRKFNNSDYHTLLLSSEFFSRLIPQLNQKIVNANFIIYLRDPLAVFESGYNQTVKRAGNISPIIQSESIQFQTLNNIDQIISSDKEIKINLRPYHDELFIGGTLINDFLTTINMPLINPINEKINPSYCFEALEFKREFNKNLKQPLGSSLDKALQGFTKGTREFSLINPDFYKKIRERLNTEVNDFIKKHSLFHLKNFALLLKKEPQKTFKPQTVRLKDFELITNFLREKKPNLYLNLQKHISESNYSQCDEFVESMQLKIASNKLNLNEIDLKELLKLINSPKKIGNAQFCKEIGVFLEKNNMIEPALAFMEAAYKFNPNGKVINKKLEEYRKKIEI